MLREFGGNMRGTAKETVHPCPDPIGRVYWYRIILRYITTARVA